ncbi:MAG: cob(I)yrinic acid a,c-diamide adenosyltransferase [Candidatus Omnitrophica bacterium]|nr:cob(I)yrinic acid a,c-diamide adenosyltransferase [Candidatus Omnitrophota bacterium]MBU1933126.1 cob(I)yrinic acid a,c-diamide adenosyltransferase [Candidatus Omnitrophota bacterium]
MIHIYTGNGKGKTTSAFGLAMRACGQGLNVIVFQFLKPMGFLCGEQATAKNIKGLKLVRFDQRHPMFETSPASISKLTKVIKKDFEKAKKTILSKKYNMVILDEIINAVDQGFINKKVFLRLLKTSPEQTELILTGRGDISDIERYADYVTVMIDKKHPFRKIRGARKGVEY